MTINKRINSLKEAVSPIPDGAFIMIGGFGGSGAMDLVHGAKRVAVVTDHVTKKGDPKLVEMCSMPLTGVGFVTRIYTSLAVVDIEDNHFILRGKPPIISFDNLQSMTGAKLQIDKKVGDLIVPKL